MTLSPIKVESFGGLNVDADPGDIGWNGAIDLCDVELDRQGLLRERDRFSSLVANTSLTDPSVVGAGGTYWIASTAASVRLYSHGAAVAAATAAPNQYVNGGVQAFGTPTTNYIYLSDNGNTNAIRRLDTAGTLTAPAGMPTCAYLTRTAADNRLVALNVASNPHRVKFSDAGNAESWGANNYVDLDPGDNEQITGGAVFGNSTYVFKYTKVFEFYGNSTDSSGNPVFNYRAMRHGAGLVSGAPAVGPDGIYFVGFAGTTPGAFQTVYRLNDGGISEVGRPIRRVLSSLAPSTFSAGSLNTVADCVFAGGQVRLLVDNNSGATRYVFSYSPETQAWSLMRMPDNTAAITGYGYPSAKFLVAGTGANAPVHVLDVTNTSTDSLRTPSGYYRSGFSDLGTPDMKRIHSWRLQGIGSPTLKLSTDFGALETGGAVTLGISPAVAEGVRRYAPRGRQFSWQLSAASGPWSVNSLVANVAGKRAPMEHASA